jgi:hypothetical protein
LADSNPERRFTIKQALQHPWFQGPTATSSEIKASIESVIDEERKKRENQCYFEMKTE